MNKPVVFHEHDGRPAEAWLFVDPRVADWELLTRDAPPTTRITVLDAGADGVTQIAAALRGVSDLAAIHILSHGAEADIRIGANGLNTRNLPLYAGELAAIGASLRDDGDILVYGCEVGRGTGGRAFVERLADITGASVAASPRPVGASALGGGWDLSVAGGLPSSPMAFSYRARAAYSHLLTVKFDDGDETTFPSPAAGGRMAVGDFDGDGDADILYQTGANGTAFQYARANGDGTFTLLAQGSSPFAGLTLPDNGGDNYHVADFDGDGDQDILVGVNGATGSYFRNDGGSFTSQPTTTFPAPGAGSRMAVGDFDGDGDTDILYQTGGNGTAFQYARSNGDGTFTLLAQGSSPFAGLTLPDNSGNNYHVGDFDGDGDQDILAGVNGATGSYFRNDGGTFTSQPTTTFPAPAAGSRMAVGDFDGDGDADILYQTGANGTAFQYARSEGDGTFTLLALGSSPFAGRTLPDHNGSNFEAADFDGDGDIDLLVGINGTTGAYFVQNGDGDGSPPELVSSNPADNAIGVSPTANLTLTFDEAVFSGGGNIYLRRTSDDSLVETISAADGAKVSGFGTATVTVNPATVLTGSTGYYLTFDLDAIVDSDGVGFGRLDGATREAITDKTFLNFTTAAPNVAPSIGNFNGDSVNFVEDGPAMFLDAGNNATVTDGDSANFDTGTVTVAITANRVAGEDVLGIQHQGTGAGQIGVSGSTVTYGGGAIGTFTGGTGTDNLVVTLNANATPAAVQALLRVLSYANTNALDPATASRTISVTVTDGDGGTSTAAAVTVGVTTVNDAPTLSATGGTPTFTEGGAAVDLFSGVSISTGESGQSINQITLTVANLADGADEVLGVDGSSVTLIDGTAGATMASGIGYSVSVVAGVATVTLSMPVGITLAAAQAVIDTLTYANTSEGPDTTARVVTLTGIRDTGGTANGGVDSSTVSIGATVSIAGENDAPTLSGGPVELPATDEDNPNTEVTVADLLAGATLADIDGDDVGIAVTGLTGNGDWEYSTDGGLTWLDFGSVSNGHALLLSPDTLVSYMPDGKDGETATIDFRAWDQSSGTASNDTTRQYADTSANGGTTAFSTGTAQASVEVAAVNDAPLFRLSPSVDLVVTLPVDGFVDVISGDGDGDVIGGSSEDGGVGPTKVVLGDFDNDGDLDVAVTSPTTNTVTVLENDSCGCMTPFETSPIPVMPSPVSMASGDFNGDGNLDLFVGNTSAIMANVLLGAGDGSFTTTFVPMPFALGLVEVVTGDFNGDSKLDVAASVAGNVIIGTGNGVGGFAFGAPVPTVGAPQPGALAVGDIDGVNGIDLVTADTASGALSFLKNDGAGGFISVPLLFGAGVSTTDLQLGDFNGDGKLDIVTSDSGLDTVSVMLNLGGGVFLPATTYLVGTDPSSLALADFNYDGALDIVVLNKGSEDIDVLLGKGDGTFSVGDTPIPTFGVPGDIAIGQMDTGFESQYPRFLKFTEGDTLALAPRLELEDVDPDGGTAVGATVFLDDSGGPGGLPGDVLSADTTGTSIVATYDPATFTLTLTGNDTLANYEKVLRTVTFSSGDDPDGSVADPGNFLPVRVIGMTVDDGKDEGLSPPIFVEITATGAQDDAFAVKENATLGVGKNLFDDNGDGIDSGPDFAIAAVNGNAGDVGVAITLPSGALLTVNVDGTFSYDPNGAFDELPGPLSGATNLSATDSFTYTLLGGYTATVTVTVTGVDSDGDVLIGNASDNTLNGGFGADTMEGKGGNDIYRVNAAGDVVVEVAGEGTADRVSANTSYILASAADIEFLTTTNSKGTTAIDLQGNALSQTIVGNDGENFLNDGGTFGAGLGSLPDILIGRAGNDTYAVYNAATVIVEGKDGGTADRVTAGVDYVLGKGVHVEYLNTTSLLRTASINLTGNEFSQVITGNDGNNVLDGGKGEADAMKGRGGNDTFYVRHVDDVVLEDAGEGFDMVAANVSYTLTADSEVEVLRTTSRFATYALDLTGNRLAQTITGNYGDNVLNGGGKGLADRLEGLVGNDTYLIYNSGDVVVENAGEGTDRVAAGVSYTLTAGAEVEYLHTTSAGGTTAINLTGNTLAQTITGNAGDNVLHDGGGGAADILRGLDGNDTYRVFNSGDRIVEGALQGATDRVMAVVDYTLGKGVFVEILTTNGSGGVSSIDLTGNEIGQEIIGNAGANRLDGKGGADTLRGFGGNDMFVFSSALGAGNVDTIVDFNPSGDRIELHKSVFAALATTGALPGQAFWASAGGAAHDNSDRILYDTATGNLYYDADGNGAGVAVHFATLTGVPSLTAGDFVVV
ncbi:FG-GAP-like repeat-containing protein [Mesorhizobium sp. LHD-90]|uniref:FG-GAP-like repeat-containing protein n=1 Tax=Mesorhizobium sp. LHD-90 TaxID=3071414 RepID=UPI0027E1C2C8|nr:FG-GAP-like repeat-containing protein [Mesorhizobium sp. LHD-90]MDQ6434273.1 FG-GAP-like repeat-containing protein [Mesorhizobium sp. LHD-90]